MLYVFVVNRNSFLVKEIQATKAAFLGSICQYSNIDEKGAGGKGGCWSKNLCRMFCKFQKQGNGFQGAVLDLAY